MARRILDTLFPLLLLGTVIFYFRTELVTVGNLLFDKYFPCQRPIEYEIGNFDKKFGITEKDFLSAIAKAEAVWEKPFGINFFEVGTEVLDTNNLKINLIFDYRQEATVEIKALQAKVNAERAEYNALRAQYEAMRKNPLRTRKEVDEINAVIDTLNAVAKKLNAHVAELNKIGKARGEEFTEGEYRRDVTGTRIDIYEYSTKDKLVRVLAHELGHALGLDHVEDPKAIMYYLNESKNGALTKDDIAILKDRCGIK